MPVTIIDQEGNVAASGGAVDVADLPATVLLESEGVVIVKHGAVNDVTRPAAAKVEWWGSVEPTNREIGDTWFETSEFN